MQIRTSILKNNEAVAQNARARFMSEGLLGVEFFPPAEAAMYGMFKQFLHRFLANDMRLAAIVGDLEPTKSRGSSQREDARAAPAWGPRESIVLVELAGALPAIDGLAHGCRALLCDPTSFEAVAEYEHDSSIELHLVISGERTGQTVGSSVHNRTTKPETVPHLVVVEYSKATEPEIQRRLIRLDVGHRHSFRRKTLHTAQIWK